MNVLLSLLILAATPTAPTDDRPPDAVEVFHCGFEASSDIEYDGWPDGWTRRHNAQFPAYLPVRTVDMPSPQGRAALRIDLNGGAAAVFSPPIEVRPLFSYVLEGYLRTEGLRHDRAWFSVTFYDRQHNKLATCRSEPAQDVREWKKFRLGPLAPPGDKAATAVIGLHLEPTDRYDLKGSALFDDVWLARLPRMNLSTNSQHNVYSTPAEIEINCQVSGIFEHDPKIEFELVDFASQPSDRRTLRRDGEIMAKRSAPASELLGSAITKPTGFAGSTTWKPAIEKPGFYRVRVRLQGQTGLMLERSLTLAVVEPALRRPQGEFGWSFPHGEEAMSLSSLGQLLPQVGIHWVKFPVWTGENDTQRLDQLVAFIERISRQGITTVGLLTRPPEDVRSQFGNESTLLAADIFSTSPDVWYRSIEPVITRLSLQVHWWQLGVDEDQSFVGYPDLANKLGAIKHQLQRFGQEVHLGIGWRAFNEIPEAKNPPWEFLALSARPALTEAELSNYLAAIDGRRTQRWVCVEPLSRDEYDVETRASDLIHRLLAAKIQGAEAIFVPRPFDPASGLMNEDGTPGELLLPWRTTALALAGSRYLGSLELPNASRNHVFARGSEVVMVVWNDRPLEEELYLGDNVRQSDVWGRSTRLEERDGRQVIPVSQLPTFVSGLSEPVVRWMMAFRFQHSQLPSICGVPHDNGYSVQNFFPQGVSGEARLVLPDVWKATPPVIDFKLAAGEEAQQPFSVSLPLDASNGRQPVRVDFDLNADRRYQFSVYRHLDVGLGDVTLEASARVNERGELEVVQQMINHTTEPVSFKCLLFAPSRRRMMSQVIRLGQDRDTKKYRFPNGAELVGQTLWLRAEELGGQRTLNFRFVAEE